MATIGEVFNKYRLLADNIRTIAADIIRSDETQLLDLNRLQLSVGLDSDNRYLTPAYRSGAYSLYKARKGSQSPFGTPDLKDTGSFYRGLYIGDKFTIQSTVSYAKDLEDKYGGSIYGLSKEDIELYIQTSFIHKLKQRISNL